MKQGINFRSVKRISTTDCSKRILFNKLPQIHFCIIFLQGVLENLKISYIILLEKLLQGCVSFIILIRMHYYKNYLSNKSKKLIDIEVLILFELVSKYIS